MHCFVMGLLKYLAIRVAPFLALHKISRIKADSDLISASLSVSEESQYMEHLRQSP